MNCIVETAADGGCKLIVLPDYFSLRLLTFGDTRRPLPVQVRSLAARAGDFVFARDGIPAEGILNQETMIIAELNLETILDGRTAGTVLPLLDSDRPPGARGSATARAPTTTASTVHSSNTIRCADAPCLLW